MKTSFTAIAILFIGTSMVSAAFEPRATMAPMHARGHSNSTHSHSHSHSKSQSKDGGIFDLSAILANPSSYLASASKAFKNPKFASEFAKETANPSFEKSLSRDLVSQFGSKTASIALQQYTAVLNKIDNSASASQNAAGAVVATSTTAPSAVSSVLGNGLASSSSAAASSTASTQILGLSSGATSSSFVSLTLLGSAVSIGAVIVLAAL